MDAIGENGKLDITTVRNIEEISTGYTLFFNGDVVVAKITPCFENRKGALIEGLSDGFGFGTTELYVLTPGIYLDGRYLYYLTISEPFRKLGEANMTGAAGQKRVPEDFVFNYPVPVISIQDQRAIADFLDRETSRIDALIPAKEKLLELLAEKRKALITRTITRGLDPGVKLRDSGVPWLGMVPEHWKTTKVAWLFRDRDERGESELPLLEVSINTGVVLREFSDDKIESTAADFNTYKIARKGDIVFNKMRMWQGAVGIAPQDGLVSPDYTVAEPTGDLLSSYAGQLFRIAAFSAECARWSHGITWDRLRIYWDGFREINVAVPPENEQQEILNYLNVETSKIDELKVATENTIELLKERRSALISEAVTGKMKNLCTVQQSEKR